MLASKQGQGKQSANKYHVDEKFDSHLNQLSTIKEEHQSLELSV